MGPWSINPSPSPRVSSSSVENLFFPLDPVWIQYGSKKTGDSTNNVFCAGLSEMDFLEFWIVILDVANEYYITNVPDWLVKEYSKHVTSRSCKPKE